MNLSQKALAKLRNLINEETEYRKGHQLVAFFNNLGFNDSYGQGFPSRSVYTDERLKILNGTEDLDKCIKNLFAPVNFIGKYSDLDKHINEFNQYIAFDNWKVVRDNAEITFKRADKVIIESEPIKEELNEDTFLKHEFKDVNINFLGLDSCITAILKNRLEEIQKCLNSNAPLSVIFLCGSTLEGILLGIATKHPKEFNCAQSAPKGDDGKVKKYHEWTLNNLINVTHELNFIKEDVKKFSHSLRDFRNFIHPYEQMSIGFNPDIHTAKISWQVLKATIFQLGC